MIVELGSLKLLLSILKLSPSISRQFHSFLATVVAGSLITFISLTAFYWMWQCFTYSANDNALPTGLSSWIINEHTHTHCRRRLLTHECMIIIQIVYVVIMFLYTYQQMDIFPVSNTSSPERSFCNGCTVVGHRHQPDLWPLTSNGHPRIHHHGPGSSNSKWQHVRLL